MKHQRRRDDKPREEEKALVMVVGVEAAKSLVRDHLLGTSQQARSSSTKKEQHHQGHKSVKVKSGRVQKRKGVEGHLTFDKPVPMWCNHQLIGDSMISRMARQYTNEKAVYSSTFQALQLGVTVHGQTISQLQRLLSSVKCPPIDQNLLLLIGTNDLLKNVPIEDSERNFKKILEILVAKSCKIVVSSIPPIPKLFNKSKSHIHSLVTLNSVIKKTAIEFANKNVSFLDIGDVFIQDSEPVIALFEMSNRDSIHWNRKGIDAFNKEFLALLQLEKEVRNLDGMNMDEES